jgi:CHAD domain-containing protein
MRKSAKIQYGTPRLTPEESMEENSKENTNFLQEIYKVRWQTYRSELKHCQIDPTEEAVHDLRVATRRLLALIDLLRDITSNPHLQKLRRALKKQLDNLDDLRDTQVMLVETSESLGELPELEPFQKYLNKREKRLLRATAKAIKSFKYSGIRKQMDMVRKKVLKQKLDTISSNLLLHAADNRFGAVMRRYQRVDQANPTTIHRMRIAFKKFRYMVEIIRPYVPGFPEDHFRFMHEYQGVMGDIQDMEVFLSAFEDFAERDASYDPKPVLRYYRQRHKESINTFIEDMHQVNTFWRSTPEAAFPWETRQQQEEAASKGKTTELPVGQENEKSGEQVRAESEAHQ